MKEVTVDDLKNMITKFDNYTKTAEQCEFAKLALLEMFIFKTDLTIICKNQKQARAMFRTIAKTIGEDYSNYKE